MTAKKEPIAKFDHAKDITIGRGRIPFISDSIIGVHAWALPGGKWTDRHPHAIAAAKAINAHAIAHKVQEARFAAQAILRKH